MSTGEPHWSSGDTTARLFTSYLDFYREKAIAKLLALPRADQERALVPSGWTPLELVHHLAMMERRWVAWGFLGQPVEAPHGDEVDGHWVVPEGRDATYVAELLRALGELTAEVLEDHGLDEVARTGGRFAADPPTLRWICFHVLQEYARHLGHLDVAVELAGGDPGE